MPTFDRRGVLGLMTAAALAPRAMAAPEETSALRADIGLLRRIYEALHPGLYRYQTPALFAARCDALEARLAAPTSLGRQYLELSGWLAQIRCGHTWANAFNQSDAVAKMLVDPPNKLPFHFVWLGDRMVVAGNPLGIEGLTRGDAISSVDDVPAAGIQALLLPLTRADGSNDAKRRALLEVKGAERIETFDLFHPLAFPNESGLFRLAVAGRDGRERKVMARAIDQKTRRAMAAKRPDTATPAYWSLSWPRPGVAAIAMPGWAMYDVKWDWRARIATMFEEIASKGARGLVIDLRDNEGGNDCGDEIIARLIDADLPLDEDYDRRVRFRSIPTDLRPYLDTWDRSFDHLGEGADDLGDGFYRLKRDGPDDASIRPRGPRFKGRAIVLSGPQNSSATFQFIARMRRAGLARVYGQPTGGNRRGINGGSFFFVRLPNSGLEADLPLVGTFPRTPQPDAGLNPDVLIVPTQEDVAAGRDAAMDRAIADLV